jgi:hypothetical protein
MLIVLLQAAKDKRNFRIRNAEGVQVQFLSTLDDAKTNADAYFYLLDINEIDATAEKFSHLKHGVHKRGSRFKILTTKRRKN